MPSNLPERQQHVTEGLSLWSSLSNQPSEPHITTQRRVLRGVALLLDTGADGGGIAAAVYKSEDVLTFVLAKDQIPTAPDKEAAVALFDLIMKPSTKSVWDVFDFVLDHCKTRVDAELSSLHTAIERVLPAGQISDTTQLLEESSLSQLRDLCTQPMLPTRYQRVVSLAKLCQTDVAPLETDVNSQRLKEELDDFCSRHSDIETAVVTIKAIFKNHPVVPHQWVTNLVPIPRDPVGLNLNIFDVLTLHGTSYLIPRSIKNAFATNFPDLHREWPLQKPVVLQLHAEVSLMVYYMQHGLADNSKKGTLSMGTSRGSCFACDAWGHEFNNGYKAKWILYPKAPRASCRNWAMPSYVLPGLEEDPAFQEQEITFEDVIRRQIKMLIKNRVLNVTLDEEVEESEEYEIKYQEE